MLFRILCSQGVIWESFESPLGVLWESFGTLWESLVSRCCDDDPLVESLCFRGCHVESLVESLCFRRCHVESLMESLCFLWSTMESLWSPLCSHGVLWESSGSPFGVLFSFRWFGRPAVESFVLVCMYLDVRGSPHQILVASTWYNGVPPLPHPLLPPPVEFTKQPER